MSWLDKVFGKRYPSTEEWLQEIEHLSQDALNFVEKQTGFFEEKTNQAINSDSSENPDPKEELLSIMLESKKEAEEEMQALAEEHADDPAMTVVIKRLKERRMKLADKNIKRFAK